MKHALIFLVLALTQIVLADVVVEDKAGKRYLVGYLSGNQVIVKSCVIVSKNRPARECRGDQSPAIKLEEWTKLFIKEALPKYDGKELPTLDSVNLEIEEKSDGLKNNEAIDPELVKEQLAALTEMQRQLIFVDKVNRALQSVENEFFDSQEAVEILTSVVGGTTGLGVALGAQFTQVSAAKLQAMKVDPIAFGEAWLEPGPKGKIWGATATKNGTPDFMNHEDATKHCKGINAELPSGYPETDNGKYGFPDWDSDVVRLQKFVTRNTPKSLPTSLVSTLSRYFWSSSVHPVYSYYAWFFDVRSGNFDFDDRFYAFYYSVRCVVARR